MFITCCLLLNPQSFIVQFLPPASYISILVSWFTAECVDLLNIPQGIWYCNYCQNMFEKEKFAENDANAIAAGRVPGVDPLEDITRRCIRIVANVEKYIGGGCVICRLFIFGIYISAFTFLFLYCLYLASTSNL